MRSLISQLFWELRRKWICLVNNDVVIEPGAIIKPGVKLRTFDGSIHISSGAILERNVYISAVDGGRIIIGKNVFINDSCKIVIRKKVEIGNGTLFGPGVYIYDHDHVFSTEGVDPSTFKTSPISIGNNCWIGARAILLRGCQIGENAVVGAGAIVKQIVPQCSLLVSNSSNQVINITASSR